MYMNLASESELLCVKGLLAEFSDILPIGFDHTSVCLSVCHLLSCLNFIVFVALDIFYLFVFVLCIHQFACLC